MITLAIDRLRCLVGKRYSFLEDDTWKTRPDAIDEIADSVLVEIEMLEKKNMALQKEMDMLTTCTRCGATLFLPEGPFVCDIGCVADPELEDKEND